VDAGYHDNGQLEMEQLCDNEGVVGDVESPPFSFLVDPDNVPL
jgi:hypothetical protein